MRRIFAVISGAVVGTILFFVFGVIANTIHPTSPELMDPKTPEAVARRVASTPAGVWLFTLLGFAVGALLAGVVGAKIARDKTVWVTGAIGLVLCSWGVYAFYIFFPAALWVPIGMLISAFLFSHLGGSLAMRRGRSDSRSDDRTGR